jgi:two-component system response regulator (stage 0 sporulation protein F)
MLLKSSYEIYTAPDGEEALNIIRERKIDLITLDLNMPKLSGIETLREIRKIDGEVPVIIITGYGTQKDEEEALLYGVRDFIPKPFNISKITSVIDGILEERVKWKKGTMAGGHSSDISVNFLPLTFEISCSGITGTMPPRHHFIEYGLNSKTFWKGFRQR